jgi:hypothetical protein
MGNRWVTGICLGVLTGGIAYTLVMTIALVCIGEGLFLVYHSYAVGVLGLQGGILGLLVSPFVIGLVGDRTAPITPARVGLAAAVGAVVAMSAAVFLIGVVALCTGSIADLLSMDNLGVLFMPCVVSAVGFVIGGTLALRELQACRVIARLRTGVQMWDSHEVERPPLGGTPGSNGVRPSGGIAERSERG